MIDVEATDWHSAAAGLVIDPRGFVGGERVEALADGTFTVQNAFSGEAFIELPDGTAADIDRAVQTARASFESGAWSAMPPSERSKVLNRWADLVAADSTLGVLESLQMGMPITLSVADKADAASLLRDGAELAEQLKNGLVPSASSALGMEIRRPQGVVGVISPWNFPVGVALTMVAPAISAGNSVVLKPSEAAPIGCLKLAELAMEAGLPAGVFNVVPGLGGSAGKALALHDDVDMLSFTGSTATGKLLMQYAGQSNIKALMLECGGKSPQIVFDDLGDLDGLADLLVQGFTFNSGQVCTNGSRILVAASLYDRLMPVLIEKVEACQTGDPLFAATKLGPLANRRQAQSVNAVLASVGDTARLLARGQTTRPDGNEVAPQLFETGDQASTLVQQEIFGPISVVTRFADESEAIRLANATRYGLSATIYASDAKVAHRLMPRLRCGVVLSYCVPSPKPGGVRFISCEPCKTSGVGSHGGLAGLAAYTRIQAGMIFLE